jgi:glycosyltransferase involved in cell wall biosynthesis
MGIEVILLDDGSTKRRAKEFIDCRAWRNLTLLDCSANRGRTCTRNEGLYNAKYAKCLFLDSDILSDPGCLLRHLAIHGRSSCVSVSFFELSIDAAWLHKDRTLRPEDLKINDWRFQCTYQASWIGCEADIQFANRNFRIVEETRQFRDWRGMFGPWCLANMVIGCYFMVDRAESVKVNGFDPMFAGYGFTETSLPTKLVAGRGAYVIPQVIGGAVHFEANPAHHTQAERNVLFQKRHRLFFGNYLQLPLEEAMTRKAQRW